MLLEHLIKIEKEYGDASSLDAAEKKLPQRVKRKRQVVDDAGEDQGFEESAALHSDATSVWHRSVYVFGLIDIHALNSVGGQTHGLSV